MFREMGRAATPEELAAELDMPEGQDPPKYWGRLAKETISMKHYR